LHYRHDESSVSQSLDCGNKKNCPHFFSYPVSSRILLQTPIICCQTLVSHKYNENFNGKNQKNKYNYAHEEKKEGSIILATDAIVDPGTVMVKPANTFVTVVTMSWSWFFDNFTFGTKHFKVYIFHQLTPGWKFQFVFSF